MNIPNTWIFKKAHNPNKGRELENPIMKVSEVLVNDGLLQTYICISPEIYEWILEAPNIKVIFSGITKINAHKSTGCKFQES